MICREAYVQDRYRWDEFCAASSNGNFRQTFAWGEIKRLSGWEPIYLYVEDGKHIRAALLMLKRRLPFFRLSVLYGCRGPVVDWADSEALRCLFGKVKQCAKHHNAVCLRIDPEPDRNELIKEQLSRLNFRLLDVPFTSWNRPRYALRVILDRSEDEIFASLRRRTRRYIRAAERKGMKIEIGLETGDDRQFYYLLKQLEREKDAVVHDYEFCKNALYQVVTAGHGALLKVVYQNKIISILLVAFVGNRAWGVYMANDYKYRQLMPNKLIQWEVLRLAINKGCAFYDMGASQGGTFSRRDGLDDFKKGYGAKVVYFPEYFDLPFRPFLYKTFHLAEFRLVGFFYKLKAMLS